MVKPKLFVTAVFLAILCFCAAALGEVAVRVVDPLRPIYDMETAREAPGGEVLLLAAPRNGSASAQVVIIGEGAGGLKAEMGPLSSPEAELPAEAVEIRYARREQGYERPQSPDENDSGIYEIYGSNPDNILNAYYDRLKPEPQGDAQLVPVWVSVRVPSETPGGVYTGELIIGDETVPVRLMVSDWVSPDPIDFAVHVGVRPTNRYVIDENWEMIEQQMKLLGALGANEIWLDVAADRRGAPLIHFTRQGGTLAPDLRLVERYIDLFAEHVGQPRHVIVDYWDWRMCSRLQRNPVSLFAMVDGERETVPLPEEPGGERFWGILMGRLASMIQEREWPAESISLAMAGDRRPSGETVAAWRHIAPYAGWVVATHGRGDRELSTFAADEPIIQGGVKMDYYSHPWVPHYTIRDGREPYFLGGWNLTHPIYSSARYMIYQYSAPSHWRGFPSAMMAGQPGAGRGMNTAAGFNLLMDSEDGASMGFLKRLGPTSIIARGRDGFVPTVRFEMLRQGLQEAEARVVIERALAGGGLDDALADEARELLTVLYNIRFREGRFSGRGNLSSGHLGAAEYPRWIELTSRLYDMAGRLSDAASPARN